MDFLGFAREGNATCTVISPETVIKKTFVSGASRAPPPGALPAQTASQKAAGLAGVRVSGARIKIGDQAQIVEDLDYGKFLYTWEGHEFLIFIVEGETGMRSNSEKMTYILTPRPEGWKSTDVNAYDSAITHKLMLSVAEWMMEAKEHVLIFDEGRWKKDQKLWEVAQRASWDNVVLSEKMKKGLRDDVEGFFRSKAFYAGFRVPWKVRNTPGVSPHAASTKGQRC